MYLAWSPHTVRAMPGHGCLNTSNPLPSFPSMSFPEVGSIKAGLKPKNGRATVPGLVGVTAASGEKAWHPVSV